MRQAKYLRHAIKHLTLFNFSCTDGTRHPSHGVHKILSVFAKKSDSPTSPKLGDRKLKDSSTDIVSSTKPEKPEKISSTKPDKTGSTKPEKITSTKVLDSAKEGWLEVLVSSTDGKVICLSVCPSVRLSVCLICLFVYFCLFVLSVLRVLCQLCVLLITCFIRLTSLRYFACLTCLTCLACQTCFICDWNVRCH